ncbi:S1-C subfamily serine protease [Deinococcus sp. HSC-46F16]|uniref:S1C family serine protease n=1 Tax=Deinococcus sp. HSC-46F16 TaxID=2910968 RepID=UPI00209C86AB|nr:S1C family serine protease [Deinococcus sp. HSC-46F16]MCP2014360.1 S1-C subfamily serine protease [Deinococcus sp. HSC-46F16]
MNANRTAAPRGLILLAALLVAADTVYAQPAAPAAVPAAPATPTRAAPAPLTAAETASLRALYEKLRPATLRIEDCPPNDCTEPNGVGTAFHIGDGYALTAYHVVSEGRNLSAVTLGKGRYTLEVVGFDENSDTALLKVNLPAQIPSMPLATARPAVGAPTLAIGNGNGTFLTLKTGRVTGLDVASDQADFPSGVLELNTRLQPGDSGGPIINAQGEVVGVISYISVARRGGITSYAVPVTRTDARLAELRRGVKREYPVIGVGLDSRLDFLTNLPADRFAEADELLGLGLGTTPGAFFTRVSPGSPAAQAGLRALDYDEDGKRIAGDIVTAVNGQRVNNFSDFQFAVRRYQPGDTITLRVLRDGKTLDLRLTLVPRTAVRN